MNVLVLSQYFNIALNKPLLFISYSVVFLQSWYKACISFLYYGYLSESDTSIKYICILSFLSCCINPYIFFILLIRFYNTKLFTVMLFVVASLLNCFFILPDIYSTMSYVLLLNFTALLLSCFIISDTNDIYSTSYSFKSGSILSRPCIHTNVSRMLSFLPFISRNYLCYPYLLLYISLNRPFLYTRVSIMSFQIKAYITVLLLYSSLCFIEILVSHMQS